MTKLTSFRGLGRLLFGHEEGHNVWSCTSITALVTRYMLFVEELNLRTELAHAVFLLCYDTEIGIGKSDHLKLFRFCSFLCCCQVWGFSLVVLSLLVLLRVSVSFRPQKPPGLSRREAQDGHLDFHTAPELRQSCLSWILLYVRKDR